MFRQSDEVYLGDHKCSLARLEILESSIREYLEVNGSGNTFSAVKCAEALEKLRALLGTG